MANKSNRRQGNTPNKKTNKNRMKSAPRRSGLELNENQLMTVCVFFIVAFYFYLRVFITSRIGLNGSAYLTATLNFILIFILLVPFSLNNIMTKLIRNKLRAGQFSNTRRLLYSGFIIAIIYSAIVSLVLFLTKDTICNELLVNKSSTFCLWFLMPAILISSLSAIYKSYIKATGASLNLLFLEIIEKIAMIISTIICTNIFMNYGNKVSLVLISPEYKYVFGAAGCSLGISIGLFIGLIGYIVVYLMTSGILNRQDNTRSVDDIYDILGWLRADLFKFSLPFFFIVLYIVIGQTFLFRELKAQNMSDMISYQWGAVGGCLFCAVVVPTMWIMSKTYTLRESLYIAAKNNDLAELRFKITEIIEDLIAYLIPLTVFVFVAAPYFVKGLLLVDSDFAIRVVRNGALLCFLLPFVVACINIMQASGKPMLLILNGIISLILGIAVLIMLIPVFKMGISGVLIAYIIVFAIYSFLNISTLRKDFRVRFDINKMLIFPVIYSLGAGLVTFLISLLLNMFLPAGLILAFALILFTMIVFIAYGKSMIISEYKLQDSFLGNVFISLGRSLNIF